MEHMTLQTRQRTAVRQPSYKERRNNMNAKVVIENGEYSKYYAIQIEIPLEGGRWTKNFTFRISEYDYSKLMEHLGLDPNAKTQLHPEVKDWFKWLASLINKGENE